MSLTVGELLRLQLQDTDHLLNPFIPVQVRIFLIQQRIDLLLSTLSST